MPLDPVPFLLSFLIFSLVLKVVYPLCSFLHEAGHAIPALLFIKGDTRIEMTQGGGKEFRLGKLVLVWGLQGIHHGSCEFPVEGVPQYKIAMVVIGGPIVSGLLAVFSLWGLLYPAWPPLPRLALAVLFYANLRIFLTSIIPTVHKFPGMEEGIPSDGKRFLENLIEKGK